MKVHSKHSDSFHESLCQGVPTGTLIWVARRCWIIGESITFQDIVTKTDFFSFHLFKKHEKKCWQLIKVFCCSIWLFRLVLFTIIMNKSNSRGESNAKLLHLLSKRTDNDHLLFTKTHWPGSKRPSLTSTIHIRNLK